MNRLAFLGRGGVMLTAACAFSGCIARGEYDRVEFARRVAAEQAAQREAELGAERSQRQVVEAERNALRRELDTKTALAENLRQENDRLAATLKQLGRFTDEVLAKGLAEPELIEITKLPPELDRMLKEFASHYPNAVEYLPEQGAVRWKSDLTFALGSDVVRDTATSSLREFAEIVNTAGAAFEVVIVGHTDNVPIRASSREHKTNWHLSSHRAIAVMFALNNFGVPYDRMGVMGYGEHRPREPNPPSGGNEKNRRVEIFLVSARDSFSGTR